MSSYVFIEPIETLAPGELVRHFIGRSNVVYPELATPCVVQLANAARVMDNRFELVGEEYALPAGFSWKVNPSRDKEWQIAHHKFYFAVDLAHAYRDTRDAAYLEKWVELLDSWLEQMGSGYITASDAQVEAKRIEHWVSSFLLLQGTPWDEVV